MHAFRWFVVISLGLVYVLLSSYCGFLCFLVLYCNAAAAAQATK